MSAKVLPSPSDEFLVDEEIASPPYPSPRSAASAGVTSDQPPAVVDAIAEAVHQRLAQVGAVGTDQHHQRDQQPLDAVPVTPPHPVPDTAIITSTSTSNKSRAITAAMAALVLALWSTSLTINTTSGSVIPPSHWRLFIAVATAGQAFGLVIVLLFMKFAGQIPQKLDTPSLTTTLLVMVPLSVIPAGNAVIVWMHDRGNDLSLVLPVLAVYILFPTLYGLFWRNEKKNLAKVVGIVLAVGSIFVMGLASATSDEEVDAGTDTDTDTTNPETLSAIVVWAVMAVLILVFGFGDIVTVSISGQLATFQIAMLSCLGAFCISASFSLWDLWVFPFPTPLGYGHARILGANMISSFAWFLYTLVGKRGSASVFVPIIGLYSLAPAVYLLALGEEDVTTLKLIGLGLAVLAVLLIGRKPSSKNRNWPKKLLAAFRFKSNGRKAALFRAKVVAAVADAAEAEIERRVRLSLRAHRPPHHHHHHPLSPSPQTLPDEHHHH